MAKILLQDYIPYYFKPILYSIYRTLALPGSLKRPVTHMEFFLEDLKARGFMPEFILDVGANRGKWTRIAKKIFPNASFFLIEPQIEMRKPLNSLCQELTDVNWIEAGAGALPGKLTLTIWDDLSGSSVLPSVETDLLSQGKQREIEIITIDSLIQSNQFKIPELVKLDIQGFELEALKGASCLFGKTEVFILEVSLFHFFPQAPILRDVIHFMGEQGYEVYDIPGFLRRPFDGALGQVDLAFAKRDGFFRQSVEWLAD